MMTALCLLIFFFSVSQAEAKAPVHGVSPAENHKMSLHNSEIAANDFLNSLFSLDQRQTLSTQIQRRPFAEYDPVGYVIFSDAGDFDSMAAKKTMAQHLPDPVVLVIFTQSQSPEVHQKIFEDFKTVISPERLRVIHLPKANNGFWARDGIPVPTWTLNEQGEAEFSVVDARYYKDFEPDREVSQQFSAQWVKHDYYHEGGNFLANRRGDCLVVNNERTQRISDAVFREKYGCLKTIRFPFTKGIGHIDETVKLVEDTVAITDDEEYARILRQNQFEVHRMLRPQKKYETYVNSLFVNGILFMPSFSQPSDEKAIALYESFGYKVIPLDSRSLSNDGLGSIHCITMAYPPVPFNELLANWGARDLLSKDNEWN